MQYSDRKMIPAKGDEQGRGHDEIRAMCKVRRRQKAPARLPRIKRRPSLLTTSRWSLVVTLLTPLNCHCLFDSFVFSTAYSTYILLTPRHSITAIDASCVPQIPLSTHYPPWWCDIYPRCRSPKHLASIPLGSCDFEGEQMEIVLFRITN